ncbi:lipopolysaccharide biosynthesis protein [Bradyrhizobium australiense]|uniref:Lipopolysaccharide biosynthesis protein n=1 Tax=Bradyrhizobium australiense TaxID=2721161 RepID=A0A7Y4GYK1_9BRAD|nr:lipopolysaccharide biosynthesis protein [Bradyrhizobium australiense]NOJ43707.1 lipopolysaccharide biosynthesis protein [Bradyrhizobium australiense]
MESLKPSAHSIRSRTAAGATMMIASRLISRCIDFAALIILARLLSPEDFGLIAIAMSVVMIVEAIMELPLGYALVALPTRTRAHYDTVFTLQVLRGLALAAILVASSWPLSQIYNDHRLIWLICALSAAPASRGLTSPRIIEFSMEFDFWPNLVIEVSGKLTALVLSVGSAWLTRSYWSLAIGAIASPVTMFIVSFIYAPYLPVFSLRKWRDLAEYVGWNTFGQAVRALAWQMDSLMLGRFVNRFELGAFSMAANLAALPGQILIDQMMNPLLVAFRSVREDTRRLTMAYQRSATGIVTLGLPIMVGLSMNAEPILRLAFGEKWLAAAPILRWLCWAVIPTFFYGPLAALAISLEKPRLITRLVVIEFVVKLPLMFVGVVYEGIAGAVSARLVTALVVVGCAMLTVRELIGLRIRDQLLGSWRPTISVAVMAVVIAPLEISLGEISAYYQLIPRLAIVVGVGAAAYASLMFLTWSLVGRPDGLESHIAGLLGSGMQRVRRASR